MKLLELFEAEDKHITFCFGRMNPPTIGHAEVFKTMANQGGDFLIFLSQSQDRKENPLSYEEKVKFIKAIHPQYASHIVENRELNTVVKVASYLYEQGYRHATFVAGSDRIDSFKKLLQQYNGIEGKAHGYYKFELLDFVSSGDRDPDSEGVSGISASKARAAAANNDFAAFKEATGAGNVAKEMFSAVRKGMGITESVVEGYGRYWCSTDKKWKTRKGPKQKRSS
jgi:DNA-binding LacI/PurR family transcriptional regulator